MTRTGREARPEAGDEGRAAEAYGRYRRSRRKRRAWSARNAGNRMMRAELEERLLALVDLAQPDLEVLDVGCGTGWLLAALAARGVPPHRLHGVDVLEERVRLARQRVPGADVRRGNAVSLPY